MIEFIELIEFIEFIGLVEFIELIELDRNSIDLIKKAAQMRLRVFKHEILRNPNLVISNPKPNVINSKFGVICVGAAFQPRLNDYGFRAASFRGWRATPTRS